jgi:ribosomal protein S18 acetylase RimI-like enzyme
MDVTLRPCTSDDASALALVGQATFLETYVDVIAGGDILRHCEIEHGRERYGQWLGKDGHAFWLAEAAMGAPVGYAMLSPPDLPIPTQPNDAELKRIYTLSRYHGSGLGRRLLAAATEGARGQGAKRLLLGVYGGNDRAMAFYLRQGFTQVGVRKFRVGANVYDDLVLARSL